MVVVARIGLGFLLTFVLAGCRREVPNPAPAVPEQLDAPKGDAIADPVLRQARQQADATFEGLLAGKFDGDPNLGPVAKKVKGYQSYSVKSQQTVREGAAEFGGVLSGPAGRARFLMTLVKQQDGVWGVSGFSGPNPE
jgi:hypothetical protein